MDNSSPFDVNIRSVEVRLNDSCVEAALNGDINNSSYISTVVEKEKQFKPMNDINNEKSTETFMELSDEFRETLHVCNNTSDCGFLNGCNKVLHDDMKRVDLTVNGMNKCNNIEIISSHCDKLNLRTCGNLTYDDTSRTDCELIEKMSSEKSLSEFSLASCDANLITEQDEDDQNVSSEIISIEMTNDVNITYLGYDSEKQMPDIMRLIQKDLSEPYSIYTYRYFIHNWPKLCFLAQYGNSCVGAIVCKLDVHKKQSRRGYIAMLAVDEKYRKQKIGSNLVLKAIHAMVEDNADEVVLETEITNRPALKLYENLGFVRDKRLFRYYLNGVDALRLKLWLR